MATKRDEQAADYRAEAIASPFAEAAERSPTVSEKGDGQSGMRTERVVLEVTHGESFGVSHWSWVTILRIKSGESVRVVDTHAEAVAESVAWEGARDAYRGRILRLTEERDAAIRERDEFRRALTVENDHALQIKAEHDALGARIAALEAQTSTAGEGLRDAQAASGGGEGDVSKIAGLAFDAGFGASREGFNGECGYDHLAPKQSTFEGDGSEPYERLKRESVAAVIRDHVAPPQPRGWLSEEEREALGNLVAAIRPSGFSIYRDEIRTVESLLARSLPPEVVLPVADCSWCSDYATVWRECLEAVRSSLAAAGVAVKEVGRD